MEARRTEVTLTYKSETQQTGGSGGYAVGDRVQFLGGPHYAASTSERANGTPAAGAATITIIREGAKHPYHIIHADSSSTVYGWVDESEITAAETSGGSESEGKTWAELIGEWTEFRYTDPAEGEADEIEVSVFGKGTDWLNEKTPELGAEITASIEAKNWSAAPGGGKLECGEFLLDDFSFSGWPAEGKVSAVSSPADSAFRETEKSKVWENVTLEEVGKEIAGNAGISLTWDVEDAPPAIKSLEQDEETDCEFFEGLCEDYGLCVKIYKNKLVVYDREAYKKKDAVATITPQDVESWDWKKTLAHTYTGGTYSYTIPIKKAKDKKVSVSIGEGPRILHKSGKADSAADAELKITAAVNNANHGATTMSFSTMGRTDLVATQCVKVEGFGTLIDGKYYLDKVTHNVSASGGYTTDYEASKVEEGSA